MYTYNEVNPMTESSNSATAGAMDVMRCDAGDCTPGPDEACVHDVYLAMRKTYGLDVTLHPSMRLSVCRFAAAMFLQCIGFRIYMRVLWGKPSNPVSRFFACSSSPVSGSLSANSSASSPLHC
jgi:hypothetical protein